MCLTLGIVGIEAGAAPGTPPGATLLAGNLAGDPLAGAPCCKDTLVNKLSIYTCS